ncbi:hypothetical protein AVEN_195988-1 [Araneus ventricosus]|uniref:Uncharacterized protein n=1 Tax=Araneus ventricosus TaxID=182803 RepID=A0A4Y2DRH4_ARAVE|nr:hypothetical protein AVEN_195988-1 [Araneus ventricosus]
MYFGLVARSRHWSRRAPVPKPDSIEVLGPSARQIWRRSNVLPLVCAEAWRRRCQLRCCPRHLTTVQNYDVRPEIATQLLQKRDVHIIKLIKKSLTNVEDTPYKSFQNLNSFIRESTWERDSQF